MPTKHLCKYPGCTQITDEEVCTDPTHVEWLNNKKREREKRIADRKPFQNAERSNDALYHDPRWIQLSRAALRLCPYCVVCGCTTNLEVDHIIAPRGSEELFFDPNNLQVLCRKHHQDKTKKEIADRKLQDMDRRRELAKQGIYE
jgi:5-methylcytosine-specific restriction protein A